MQNHALISTGLSQGPSLSLKMPFDINLYTIDYEDAFIAFSYFEILMPDASSCSIYLGLELNYIYITSGNIFSFLSCHYK